VPLDTAHARDWIITNQLGRRNLTAEQKKYLIGLRFNSEKKPVGANQHSLAQNEPATTADRLAEEYKVSRETIKRDDKFAEVVDKIAANIGSEARQTILRRDSGLTAQNVVALARKPVEEQRT
jgi:hypothetical protein